MSWPGLFQHLSEVVHRLREEQKLSQRALARRAGVSTSTVSRLESGEGASLTAVDQVLAALGVSDWVDLLKEFALTAARGARSGRDSRRDPSQAPLVLRLEAGGQDSVAAYLQVGERRILLIVNLLDLTSAERIQGELPMEGPRR